MRLCVTCRSSFLPFCLPLGHSFPIVEHGGFAGMEYDACRAFFEYYKLDPPVAPILPPEFANPLYLRLVCKTLQSRGLRRLPSGWNGISLAIQAFLEAMEDQFAVEYAVSTSAGTVRGGLMAVARAIAEAGGVGIPWSKAHQVIATAKPHAASLPVLDWLIRAELLTADAPTQGSSFDSEGTVRIAFQRLGDFLVAAEMLERCKQEGVRVASLSGGKLHALWKNADALGQNSGVIAALSILLAEQHPSIELPDLAADDSTRVALLRIAVQSFCSRDPGSISAASQALIIEALGQSDCSFETMDALIAMSWQKSAVDAFWVDELHRQNPLARRDAYWCNYLHERFSSGSSVHGLIHAAFGLPLDQLDTDVAERWATVLLWFTAAADRRVKDSATRAATAVLTACPQAIHSILPRLLECDDDCVRERALLSSYGALIASRNTMVLRLVVTTVQALYRRKPETFDNALIRDHIRCISELARKLRCLPKGCTTKLSMLRASTDWPLKLPSDGEAHSWGNLLEFLPDQSSSDFFKYSMNCLRTWEHAMTRVNMAKWILRRIVTDFGYEGSGCENYDKYMLSKHGGGRGRTKWAERIGKKYQWIGMYQLASRLHDNVKRKSVSWEPRQLRQPLILVEERKIDPTLPWNIAAKEGNAGAWWIGASADLGKNGPMIDNEWLARRDDIPSFQDFLALKEHNGQHWRPLVSYPEWSQRDADEDGTGPYRRLWIRLTSHLVKQDECAIAYDFLTRKQKLFAQALPGGATYSYGFAGEYPWAIAFNTEPEEWHGDGGIREHLPVLYQPAWNHLEVEWEYDATLPRRFQMAVPARHFFTLDDLWWCGNGYRRGNAHIVFQNPSLLENGPDSLLADADDLPERLSKLGLRLIWTLVGEKQILGGRFDTPRPPQQTFSQVACLEENGSVQFGERVFFVDDVEDTVTGKTRTKTRGSGDSRAKRRAGDLATS